MQQRSATLTGGVVDSSAEPALDPKPGNGSGQLRPVLPDHVQAPGLHAGFWMRVAAYLLDSLILMAAMFIMGFIFAALEAMGQGIKISVPGWQFLNLGITWFYFALFESSAWQATPGKRALGLRVVDKHGSRVGLGRATGRFFGKFVSTLSLFIGYMMAAWTARKQTLHDMMAGCCVVRQGGLDAMAENRLSSYRASMPTWAVVWIVCASLGFFVVPMLAAIAIPAYQDYVVRTQVSTGMASSEDVRSRVDLFLHRHGRLPESNAELGLAPPSALSSKYLASIEVARGKVLLTYGGDAVDSRLRDKHLAFVAQLQSGSLVWSCSSPDMAGRFLPPRCRD